MTRLPTDKTLISASALVPRRQIRNALYPESFIQQIKSRLAHDIATQILKQVEITETEDMETDMIRYSAEFHCLTASGCSIQSFGLQSVAIAKSISRV